MTANTQPKPVHNPCSRLWPWAGVILAGVFFGTFPQALAVASASIWQPEPGREALPASPGGTSSEPPTDPVLPALAAIETDPEGAVAELAALLQDPDQTPVVLSRLNERVSIPIGLWRPVSKLTGSQQPEDVRVAATAAVARFGTREAVETLVLLTQDATPSVAAQARTGLTRLTGLGGPPARWSSERWAEWAREAATWNDRTLSRTLITQQAEARGAALADAARLQEKVLDLYRRLHVELDADGRSSLLAELISDDRAWLRSLGFELAGRDLSARTALNTEVAVAAAAQLKNADASTRAQAAILIGRLVPPDAMLLLTTALRAETNPRAAEPMLLGVARWPNPDAVDPVIRWLEREDAPIDASSTAAWSLAQGGYLGASSAADRALSALRARPLDRIGLNGMRMLVRLGGGGELGDIAALIADPDHPQREAAAEALIETPAGLARLNQWSSDPRLFGVLARGITRHNPTPSGFARIAGLPRIEDEDARDALLAHAARLGDESLGEAVEASGINAGLAESVLARLMTADPGSDPRIADGLLRLAQIRAERGDVVGASESLAVLGNAPLPEPRLPVRRGLSLRVALGEGDLDRAFSIDGISGQDWIAALSRLPEGDPTRRLAADRLLATMGGTLTQEQFGTLQEWATEGDSTGEGTSPETGEPTTETGLNQPTPGEPEPAEPEPSGPGSDNPGSTDP